MKVKEMILLIENEKGTEHLSLVDFDEYLKRVSGTGIDAGVEDAIRMIELVNTMENKVYWVEVYFAANKSVSARYCQDIDQLQTFLSGEYCGDEYYFKEDRCTPECLEKLKELGLQTDGQYHTGAGHETEFKIQEKKERGR